jgi:hypothetical protein
MSGASAELDGRGRLLKAVLLYLVLVGTPVLGLLAILRAGERIAAPRHLAGVWELSPEAAGRMAAPCLSLPSQELVLVQSGRYVEMRFGRSGSSFQAKLEGDSLAGTLILPEGASCQGAVELRARVVSDAGRDRLLGQLVHDACTTCPETDFAAVRRPERDHP